ncbi:MAG: hypothetical protein ACI38Q_08070 [Candidatus Bruticola sp.]
MCELQNRNNSCECKKDELLEVFLGSDLGAADTQEKAADAERIERERLGLAKVAEELNANPKSLEGIAFELLGNLLLGGVSVVDKVAELMMDKNPVGYVNAIFKAADRCTVPYVKFALVRSVFRRYPGRYRPYIMALGRELISGAFDEHTIDVTSWLLQKFGAEILPDLVSFMRSEGHGPEKIKILHDTVQMLGSTALPVVTAAADSDCAKLAQAGLEALKRVGQV